MVGLSIALSSVLRQIPVPVLFGVFLYMGKYFYWSRFLALLPSFSLPNSQYFYFHFAQESPPWRVFNFWHESVYFLGLWNIIRRFDIAVTAVSVSASMIVCQLQSSFFHFFFYEILFRSDLWEKWGLTKCIYLRWFKLAASLSSGPSNRRRRHWVRAYGAAGSCSIWFRQLIHFLRSKQLCSHRFPVLSDHAHPDEKSSFTTFVFYERIIWIR